MLDRGDRGRVEVCAGSVRKCLNHLLEAALTLPLLGVDGAGRHLFDRGGQGRVEVCAVSVCKCVSLSA